MIFVATGVHEHAFNRLVKAMDKLAELGIVHDVFIQTGFSDFQPKYCKWSKAIDFPEFEQCMDEADIIISHGGAGCIAGALERNKPTILVPRLKKYNEHNDDRQLELASVLEKSGRVLVVRDINDLAQMIEKVWDFKPKRVIAESNIVDIIRDFLVETAEKKGIEFNIHA